MATNDKDKKGGKGPVRPPVLDMQARPAAQDEKPAAGTGPDDAASKADPGGRAAAGKSDIGKTDAAPGKPRQTPPDGQPVMAIVIAAAAAATALGAALAFGIAALGYWPVAAQPQLSGLPSDVAALGQRVDRLETANAGAVGDTEDLAVRLDKLASEVNALPTANDAADLAPLETRIETIETRLAALANRAGPEGTSAATGDIATLGDEVATLKQTLADKTETLAAANRKLSERIAALEDSLPEQGDARIAASASPRLPLALSGFEAAIRTGAPYRAELDSLAAALPNLDVPGVVADNAQNGLPDPVDVGNRLERAVPAMLAAMPGDPNAGWTERLVDRLKSIVALRPTSAATGAGPEADIARIETAVARRNFPVAQQALRSLPAPMRDAAGPVAGDIAALAAAARFATSARQAALAPAEPATGGAQ